MEALQPEGNHVRPPPIREHAAPEAPRMRTAGRAPWRLVILAALAALATSCEEVRVTIVEVASLTVDPSEGTVAPGDTLRLRATLRDASGNDLNDRPIEWRSEDPEVVRLEGDGLVRGMLPGTTTVSASSEGATGEASITVRTGPDMVLSPSRLTFEAVAGGDPTSSRSVGISKEGPGILEGIEVSVVHPSGESTGWLDATLAGTTAPTVVSIRADPSALPAGTHRADVEVIAAAAVNSPQVIEVTFEVEEAFPVVRLDPQSVGFAVAEGEGVPAPQVVSVTNGGGGELTDLEASISYAEDQPTGWLDAELAGTTAPTELTLRVDPSGLESPAVFDAVVDVTSPVAESSGRVQVRFRLGEPPPEIDLDPTEIGWEIVEDDESPPTREVAIENRGTGTLGGLSAEVVYGAGAAEGWLEVVVEPSVAPAVLTASLATTALLPGDYEATIQVLSDDAINSPQSVGVSLQVAPRASPETSVITTSHAERVADGSSTAVITVQLRDARGDDMPSGGDAVQLTTTRGTLSSVSDQGDGTYTANLTSTTSGTATITGTVNSDPIDDDATVQFVAGPPATVQITGGNNQTGTVGQELSNPLEVRVVDANNNP
ncbi:MAG TPA: invasin domain 3-containing protein, partial [Acidimicrobiia bacterium]|nr:invasin domain 3-containing protein [Acidimicrobiia bacterium]